MTFIHNSCTLTLLALVATACAHLPPEELVDAREAWRSADAGIAAQLVPAELHVARTALDEAELAFEERWSDYAIRDLSYVAERKAQLAVALASAAASDAEKAASTVALERARATKLVVAGEDLEASQNALARSQSDLERASTELSGSEQARLAAEERATSALAALADAKQEPRGLVITLSGSVLFQTDDATLLPNARTRLDQVSDALLTHPDRHLVVEGHTDSRGDDAYNLELSQRRAESVREVIVARGYRAELVIAKGIGEARPVADNATPEGMANNRRVEIIVENANTTTGRR
jgi:outer membrane protein OmpA-like peptidoglycan-associated protein